MVILSLPIAFSSIIGIFAPIFSRPVWQHGQVLLTGAVLAPGQRTVTAILQIMGRSAALDFQTYHRVLHRAVWPPLTASRLLLRLLGVVVIMCLPVLGVPPVDWLRILKNGHNGRAPFGQKLIRPPKDCVSGACRTMLNFSSLTNLTHVIREQTIGLCLESCREL